MEAVQELQPPEDGLFLVRESVRHPGDYVLCVSFGKEVIHYRVVHEENTLSIDSQQYFSNLIDMIEVRPPRQMVPPVSDKGNDLMGSHRGRSLSCSVWFSLVFVTWCNSLSPSKAHSSHSVWGTMSESGISQGCLCKPAVPAAVPVLGQGPQYPYPCSFSASHSRKTLVASAFPGL